MKSIRDRRREKRSYLMAGIYFVKLKVKQIVHQEEVGHAHTVRGHGGDLKLAVLGPHLL